MIRLVRSPCTKGQVPAAYTRPMTLQRQRCEERPRKEARRRPSSSTASLQEMVRKTQAMAGNHAACALVTSLARKPAAGKDATEKKPGLEPAAAPPSPDDPARITKRATEALELVRDTLIPAFRSAVDGLDAAAAFELARAIVEMMRGARRDVEDVSARLGLGGGDARAWEAAVAGGAAPEAKDWEAEVRLTTDVDLARRELQELTDRLAYDVGPRVFRGTVVSNDPVPAGQRTVEAAGAEAAVTVELVNTVQQVRQLIYSAQAGSLQQAVDLVEGWRGRPVNFLFLYAALQEEKLLGLLSMVAGSKTGRNVFGMHAQAEQSARDFGMLLDVGAFELEEAVTLLSYYWDDWAITDKDAMKVIEMWASASPEARVVILDKLEAEDRLGRLCSNLPGLAVKAMDDVARLRPGSKAAQRLREAVADLPEGTTATELYEQNIMEDIKEEKYVRAYLWTLLNTAHSALTFGFKDIHDHAYTQMREGLISSDEYWSTTTKAAGRTAVILAATAVTGGTAGGWAEGLALGRGVGATTAGVIGGGAGGAASGFAGQLTGDLYDQALLDKKGFSSALDYLAATGGGAVTGTFLAGVGAAGGRAFPASAQETFRYHSGGGRYRILEDFRQGLHGLMYRAYRGSVSAGRRVGTGGTVPENAELFDPDNLAHILEGESEHQGGHRWPPNPKGGPASPGGGRDPKTPFPRTWNDERIIDVVADATTDPNTVWVQQNGPGQGTQVTGLPARPPTTNAGAPVRYRADIVVEGVTIRVVVEPGGEGIITAFPVNFEDPANLLQFVRPQAKGSDQDEENRPRGAASGG
jgi:hypothetical protein